MTRFVEIGINIYIWRVLFLLLTWLNSFPASLAGVQRPFECRRLELRFGELSENSIYFKHFVDKGWELVLEELLKGQNYTMESFTYAVRGEWDASELDAKERQQVLRELFEVEVAVDAKTQKLLAALAWRPNEDEGEGNELINVEAIAYDSSVEGKDRVAITVGLLNSMKRYILPTTNLDNPYRRIQIDLGDHAIPWMHEVVAAGYEPDIRKYARFFYEPVQRPKYPRIQHGAAKLPIVSILPGNIAHGFKIHSEYFENPWPESVLIALAQRSDVVHLEAKADYFETIGHILAIEDTKARQVEILDISVDPRFQTEELIGLFLTHLGRRYSNVDEFKYIVVVLWSEDFAGLNAAKKRGFKLAQEIEDKGKIFYHLIKDLRN